MSIYIKDETANALVLTIDNSGNMSFGDGTPVNLLSVSGASIIDFNGYIVHGVRSSTISSASGSVNLAAQQSADISTIPGVVPIVQLDTSYSAVNYRWVGRNPENPDDLSGGAEFTSAPNYALPVHGVGVNAGFFTIFNFNTLDGPSQDPGSPYYSPDAGRASCNYRWL